jgi:hypothetical protein
MRSAAKSLKPSSQRSKKLIPGSLYDVVTVQEAAQIACVGEGTIRYHIDRGNLIWRKTERVYLISLESLKCLYGESVFRTAAIYLQN